MNEKFKGKWLNASEGRPLGPIDLIIFDDNKIKYSFLDESDKNFIIKEKKESKNFENISQVDFEFINPNRIRFYHKGKTISVLSDTESITTDTIFEHDYVRLFPTISNISESRIQLSKYHLKWNNEELVIEFNKILDKPYIQEMYKRFNQEGMKILLEKLNETLLISIYINNERDLAIPIKEVDEKKLILYGFPKEPYEVSANRIK